jgi:Fe-Mn family superoxide dismutase
MDRRTLIGGIGAAGLTGLVMKPGLAMAQTAPAAAPPPPPPPFSLPPLGYAYEALEPHIDTMTMRIHHSAHHNAFIGGLNTLAPQWDQLRPANIETILRDPASIPEAIRTGVRNSLGGHWNHTYFWDLMTPGGPNNPTGALKSAIEGQFGSVANLVTAFNAQGMGRFGSGWAWLVVDKDGKLAVINTPYQDTPLELGVKAVVIGCDVWEHAYYLKHQNRRADYLRSWWSTVNWNKAAAHFAKA